MQVIFLFRTFRDDFCWQDIIIKITVFIRTGIYTENLMINRRIRLS